MSKFYNHGTGGLDFEVKNGNNADILEKNKVSRPSSPPFQVPALLSLSSNCRPATSTRRRRGTAVEVAAARRGSGCSHDEQAAAATMVVGVAAVRWQSGDDGVDRQGSGFLLLGSLAAINSEEAG
nr:hypothetical protein Iba_chr01bCG3760 [Ipomoea batatas]